MKRNMNFMIDEDNVQKLRKRGGSMSAFVNQAVTNALDNEDTAKMTSQELYALVDVMKAKEEAEKKIKELYEKPRRDN